MTVIVLESLRAFVHVIVFLFLIKVGRERFSAPSVGWNWLIAGFGLMAFGSLIDITDNFDSLSRFVVLGKTPVQAFLEKIVGYLIGFITLAIGLFIWIPKEFQELRQAQTEVKKSERDYRRLVETSQDLIWSTDADGRYTFVNEAAKITHGYEPSEMIGRTYKEFMTAEQIEKDHEALRKIDKNKSHSFELETSQIRKDGSLVHFILNGVFMRDEQGNFSGTTGTAKDITLRKKNQKTLRQVEERFRKMYQSSPALVAISTAEEAIILDINDAWSETLGYSREEAINSTPYELGIFADPESRRRAVRTGGQSHHFSNEAQYITKTGEVRDFLVSGESIEFEGRDCYLFISQDITDLKLAEQEARVHRDQLEHVSRVSTMGEMATSLAHELNQPLAAMTAYVDGCLMRLRAGETPSEEILEALGKASGQAHRAGRIIRRLRDFIADTGSHIGTIYLNDAVNAVVEMTETEIRHAQIRLRLDLGDHLPPVIGDEILLQQVILNLARNSIEAMTGSRNKVRNLTIRTEIEDRDNLLFTICDTGPGVIGGETENIFEPYFTTKESGLGLGLSICRSIIERHNGRIWAEPIDGKGIRVSIRLPSAG